MSDFTKEEKAALLAYRIKTEAGSLIKSTGEAVGLMLKGLGDAPFFRLTDLFTPEKKEEYDALVYALRTTARKLAVLGEEMNAYDEKIGELLKRKASE